LTMDAGPGRIEAARRRAGGAKRALAAAAAAGFVLTALLARNAHPGHATTTPTTNDGSVSTSDPSGTFDFGTGSLAPSNGTAPQGSTHVS